MKRWSMVLVMIGSVVGEACATIDTVTAPNGRTYEKSTPEGEARWQVEQEREAREALLRQGRVPMPETSPIREYEAGAPFLTLNGRLRYDTDKTLPAVPPKLTFDLAEVAGIDPTREPGSACEVLRRWDRYVSELPEMERKRSERRVQSQSDSTGIAGLAVDRYGKDPFTVIYVQRWRARLQVESEAQRALPKELDFSTFSDQDLARVVELHRCAGMNPPGKALAIIEERREAAKCDADPKCVATRNAEQAESLRVQICADMYRRQNAKANAKEELSYARETGVVDLENLNDNKTLMIAHDRRAADGMAEYLAITGKKFDAKKSCR